VFRESPQFEATQKPAADADSITAAGTAAKRRDLTPLRRLVPFLKPYRAAIGGACVSLTVAAGTVLGLGAGLRALVDQGFAAGNAGLLDKGLLVMLGVICILAASTYGRFYLVSWIGERVVADLRRAVFDHVVKLSPSFFESTRTGEVLSRLTTDTTVLQVVVGSTVSIALRNLLLLIGGSVMLLFTSAKLTGLVFLVVPLVVFPIVIFGRRVRKLSRESQDRVADIGSFVDEALSAIRTVQAYGHEDAERRNFAGRVEDAFDIAIKRVRTRALLTVIVIVLVFTSIGTILWVGGHDVLAGRLSAGDLSAFVFYAVVVAGSVGAISEVVRPSAGIRSDRTAVRPDGHRAGDHRTGRSGADACAGHGGCRVRECPLPLSITTRRRGVGRV